MLVPTASKTIGFFLVGVIRASRSLAVINLNVKTYDETAVIVMYLSFLLKMVRSDFEDLLKGKREIDISRPIEIHNTVGSGFSRLTIRN